MKVKLWGVRGSHPTPLNSSTIENKIIKALTLARPGDLSSEESVKEFVENLPLSIKGFYGGNTTCIEVRTLSGEIIIIDCGSGLINLGRELMKEDFASGKGAANIILTHTHWDHIHGIPFFTPLYIKGNRFNIYSALKDIKERLDYQQVDSHFPLTLDSMAASKRFFSVKSDEFFFINDIKIFVKSMPHPGGAYGVRIEDGESVFVYTSDCEFSINEIDLIHSYNEFFHDADLLLFDTQYTFEESVGDKISWGHSSASIAIDIASMNSVKKLVLFHHDPNYDDEKLDSVLSNALTYVSVNKRASKELKIELASEETEYEI